MSKCLTAATGLQESVREPAVSMLDAAVNNDPAKDDLLILVDVLDRQIGTASKLRAHVDGLLHRAFSVVLVRRHGDAWEILLTKRAEGKYHSAGLWTNACCSHPRAGESLDEAVPRRLKEELGIEGVDCREVGSFVYRHVFADGLSEYEYDHTFVAAYDGEVHPDPTESSDARWVSEDELVAGLCERPDEFSAWCAPAMSLALRALS